MKSFLFFFLLFLPLLSIAQNAEQDSLELIFSETIYFNFGKYELRPEADSVLRQLMTRVDSLTSYLVIITAHTDSIGSLENNKVLSENRAAAVKTGLSQMGMDTTTVQTSTFGETRPTATNKDEVGRQENRRATIDVFKVIPIFKLKGRIVDQETGEGIAAQIIIHSKESRDSLQTDKEGYFEKKIKPNTVVGIDVLAKGYFLKSKMFRVEDKAPSLQFPLIKAQKGKSADIQNLYFVGNKAILLPRSQPVLPKVLAFMEINYDLVIEIAGHINRPNAPPVKEEDWNFQLSVRRAKLIYDYLIENGIDPERVTFKGYGNSEMRYPFARSEKQQSLNRRVEIKVLGTVWDE